jgi:hypothetical protein
VTVRATLIAFALTLALAAPASAAELTVRVTPSDGVRLGNATTIAGRVTEGGAPLPGRTVRLEVRKHPFKRAWRLVASKQTDADGRYSFAREFKRNHHVRVRLEGLPATEYTLPQPDVVSPRRNAYVLPAFTLSFKQRGSRGIRITQTYTVPKAVKLTAPTRFYVGPCRFEDGKCTARFAPLRAVAKTRELRAGRFRATAVVKIPKRFGGRFQYVSCFTYSKGSGMGDPDQRCPKRSVRLRR